VEIMILIAFTVKQSDGKAAVKDRERIEGRGAFSRWNGDGEASAWRWAQRNLDPTTFLLSPLLISFVDGSCRLQNVGPFIPIHSSPPAVCVA
jgi:hypothetical protein